MPVRPAIKCEWGLLKDVDSDAVAWFTMNHVTAVGDDHEYRCCVDDGVYCSFEALTTPHMIVPEVDFVFGLFVAVALLGALYERSRQRRRNRAMRGVWFKRQRQTVRGWLREVLRRRL